MMDYNREKGQILMTGDPHGFSLVVVPPWDTILMCGD
jgi:hypothetical protein